MKNLKLIAAVLLLIAGLNWGCIGLFSVDVVGSFVTSNWWYNFINILFGLSAIYAIVNWKSFKNREHI